MAKKVDRRIYYNHDDYETLKSNYDQLKSNFDSIVNSKRWQIMNKILHIFGKWNYQMW